MKEGVTGKGVFMTRIEADMETKEIALYIVFYTHEKKEYPGLYRVFIK